MGGNGAQANDNGSAGAQYGSDDDASNSKKTRAVRSKPLWQPLPAVVVAMKEFEDQCNVMLGSGLKVKKGVYPRELDTALQDLDSAVNRFMPGVELNYSGYFESICSPLGGQEVVSLGIVKNSLMRIRLKRVASEARSFMESSQRQLFQVLMEKVAPYTETPTTGTGTGTGAGADGEAGDGAGSNALDAGALSPTKDKGGKDGVAYTHIVKWDIPLRSLLAQAEAAVLTWTSAENRYRKTLTALDKKGLDRDDVGSIDDKTEVLKFLAKVEASFPPATKQGDIATLRKNISTEKNRTKRKSTAAAAAIGDKGLGQGPAPKKARKSMDGVVTGTGSSVEQPSPLPLTGRSSSDGTASYPGIITTAPSPGAVARAPTPRQSFSGKKQREPIFSDEFYKCPPFNMADFQTEEKVVADGWTAAIGKGL